MEPRDLEAVTLDIAELGPFLKFRVLHWCILGRRRFKERGISEPPSNRARSRREQRLRRP